MEFDNLIGVLQEFGIDITNTKVVINWVQLVVVVFALVSMSMMLKTVLKECSTRVKILAGLCTVSILLMKCNEYLNVVFKAKKLLKYSTYTLYVSIAVTVAMVLFYKFYGVQRDKLFNFGNKGSKTQDEPVKEPTEDEFVGGLEVGEFDIDNTDFDLEV